MAMKQNVTGRKMGVASTKTVSAKSSSRKGGRNTRMLKGERVPTVTLMIRGSKSKHVSSYTYKNKLGKSKISAFIILLTFLDLRGVRFQPMRWISLLKTPMELLNTLNAREVTLSVKWDGDSSGPFYRTSTKATTVLDFEL